MKTYIPKQEQIERRWYLVDAEGKVLGRLASEVAQILRGKNKAIYTPHLDVGDHVIVVNAEKIRVTGNKLQNKIYYRYSGYPGGLKQESLESRLRRHPERVLEEAIRGMLPHNRVGRKIFKKLKVYRGPQHPHRAQKPEPLDLESV